MNACATNAFSRPVRVPCGSQKFSAVVAGRNGDVHCVPAPENGDSILSIGADTMELKHSQLPYLFKGATFDGVAVSR